MENLASLKAERSSSGVQHGTVTNAVGGKIHVETTRKFDVAPTPHNLVAAEELLLREVQAKGKTTNNNNNGEVSPPCRRTTAATRMKGRRAKLFLGGVYPAPAPEKDILDPATMMTKQIDGYLQCGLEEESGQAAAASPEPLSSGVTEIPRLSDFGTTIQSFPSGENPVTAASPSPAAEPGAFPAYPSGHVMSGDFDSTTLMDTSSLGQEASQEIQPQQSGLAEATPVPEDESQQAPHQTARPMESEKEKNERQFSLVARGVAKTFCAIATIVAVALVITFTLNGLHKRSSNNTTNNNEEQGVQPTTANPTMAPTSILDAALDMGVPLPNFTVQTIENDRAGITPQSMALQWLMQDPNLHLNYTNRTRLLQRYAAVTFYYATGGNTSWINQGGGNFTTYLDVPPGGMSKEFTFVSEPWLSYRAHECDWFWTFTRDAKPICRRDGTFQFLDLSSNDLSGTLPEELGILTWLDGFRFGWSKMHGTLTTQIGRMSNLQEFRINRGQFTGKLPTEIGLLSNSLRDISIGGNRFEGNLMEDLRAITKLERIMASRNHFRGSIPEDSYQLWPNLTLLQLSRNQLSGSVPAAMGRWSSLGRVMLGWNQFDGTLPTELGSLSSSLTEFHIGTNQLSGTLPSELGLLTSLTKLLLYDNPDISGSFPSELRHLGSSLKLLKFENTAIAGTLPEELCSIETLIFDCSPFMCGCDMCPCSNNHTNNNNNNNNTSG